MGKSKPPPIDFAEVAAWTPGRQTPEAIRQFERISDGHYRWTLLPPGLSFDLDRMRRERHELVGELQVGCDLAGAHTVNGILNTSDFNLSSAAARQARAKLLAERARTADVVDWMGYLDEFCQRVFAADRAGSPVVALHQAPMPVADPMFDVSGFRFLRHHPTILFGDGGTGKSYLALYFVASLAAQGVPVLYLDWELDASEHRARLARLFPDGMPTDVHYLHCIAPLVDEADRIRKVVASVGAQFAVLDSIGFACDGPPEAAEVALAYLRATRALGVGSLHLAHVSKADSGDQKPFGSAFWHNGARMTWFIQADEDEPSDRGLTVGLFQRKSNLSAKRASVGFALTFGGNVTVVTREDLRDVPALAAKMSLSTRIVGVVAREGLKTAVEISEALGGANPESINRIARRSGQLQRVRGADGIWRIGAAAREPEHVR